MKLSSCRMPEGAYIARDGEFLALGYLNTNSAFSLSCYYDSLYRLKLEANSNISCLVTTEELAKTLPDSYGVIIASDPLLCFLDIHRYLALETDFYGKKEKTIIDEGSHIHPSAIIAENNVKIGKKVTISAGTVIFANTSLGDEVIVRSNSVIGTDGFEFKRKGGSIIPVYHAGGVSLGNRVEVQACTCISRSLFGERTEIGEDSKIDNLVHIAHNVKIGKRCLIAANAMVAGSTTIGDDVWIGPGAQISSSLSIGDSSSITLGAVVVRDVPPGGRVSGNFAIEHNKFLHFIKSISSGSA